MVASFILTHPSLPIVRFTDFYAGRWKLAHSADCEFFVSYFQSTSQEHGSFTQPVHTFFEHSLHWKASFLPIHVHISFNLSCDRRVHVFLASSLAKKMFSLSYLHHKPSYSRHRNEVNIRSQPFEIYCTRPTNKNHS